MKKLFFLLLLPTILFAQTPTRNPAGFLTDSGTIAPSAILEARSTTKGFLAPRMTTTQRNAISSPATSLLIFNTTTGQYEYWDGSAWTSFGGKFLKLTGTDPGDPVTGDILMEGNVTLSIADGDNQTSLVPNQLALGDGLNSTQINANYFKQQSADYATFIIPGEGVYTMSGFFKTTLMDTFIRFEDLTLGYTQDIIPNPTPTDNIVLQFPTGLAAGTYTIATLENLPPSDAAGDGTTIVAGVIEHEDLSANSLTTAADVWSRDLKADRDLILTAQTASTVAIIDATNRVVSADTATYPDLTELSYGKGVTSAIQTQLNAKEPAISGTGFVYSASGTKSVVSDTGTGNVVRDTAPSLSGLVTHAGGTLTGASAATMFQSMTGTFNGTGIFKGIFMNVTNTASNNQSRLIDMQTGGNSRFNVSVGGDAYASNSITAGAYVEAGTTAFVSWTGRSRVYSPANGDFRLTNTAGTDFGKLQFGGSTSSFPAVKRNAATLEIKLADDSEFAAVQTLYDRFGAGSPESIVTAPVGAVYHRTDGGAGTSLYVKESGTGNTGWVAK